MLTRYDIIIFPRPRESSIHNYISPWQRPSIFLCEEGSLSKSALSPPILYPLLMGILSLDIVMVRPSRNNPCTEGSPLPPTCLLCQMEIPATFTRAIAGYPDHNQLLKDRQPWKSYWRTSHKHMMVPSAKVEEADFADLPRLWSCFCRASKL